MIILGGASGSVNVKQQTDEDEEGAGKARREFSDAGHKQHIPRGFLLESYTCNFSGWSVKLQKLFKDSDKWIFQEWVPKLLKKSLEYTKRHTFYLKIS